MTRARGGTAATRRAPVEEELRWWKKAGVVTGVVGASLGAIIAFATIVHVVFRAGMTPYVAKVDSVYVNVNKRISEVDEKRAEGDSTIGLQVSILARMVVTPDSAAQAILLEQVQGLSPNRGGK